MNKFIKLLKTNVILCTVLLMTACGGGSSSSGSGSTTPDAGDSFPEAFIGTYVGTATVTATAIGVNETETENITLIVKSDGTITYQGEETFTTDVSNSGDFSGSVTEQREECSGTIIFTGKVDGHTASGPISGDGVCDVDGVKVDFDISGSFKATK